MKKQRSTSTAGGLVRYGPVWSDRAQRPCRGTPMALYDSILHTIGRTPIVRVNRLAPQHVTMYVKCEFFNPLSSVKDRIGFSMIEDGIKSGKITKVGR